MDSLDVVWTESLRNADRDEYDRFVAEAAGGHYAQTLGFGAVARRAGPCRLRYFLARDRGRLIGTALVTRASLGPAVLPSAKVERGPVCDDPSELCRVARALARTARSRGVVRLSVMPYWADAAADVAMRALREAGFRDSQRADGAHARTLRIDLGRTDDEEICSARGQERLRRRREQACRAGAITRKGGREDFETHFRLTEEMMRAQGKRHRPASHARALAGFVLADSLRGALFVCELGGKPVATALVLRHAGIATYAQGATSLEKSSVTKSVPVLLAAIQWARTAGCHTFDLGGIPLEGDRDAKRAAIARLKFDFARDAVRLVREHTRLF
jgi:lipid II:glycine glycyltransferase (peptidoglycan interpeptide bridge formation enzyme)